MKKETIKEYIDITITPENCEQKGYFWNGDIIVNLNSKNGTYATYKDSFDQGSLLGKPKDISGAYPSFIDQLFGFYIPIEVYKAQETPDYFIDDTLTPENASQSGLEYLYDVYYSKGAPREINDKVIELVEKKGYILGTNSDLNDPDPEWVGVYSPKKDKTSRDH